MHAKQLYIVVLTFCALLSACAYSDDAEFDVLSRFNADGKAWMCIDVMLPNPATRATFEDGDADDYDVNTDESYLLIFAGASEQDAKFASAYKLSLTGVETPAHPQVTRRYLVEFSKENIHSTDKLFAFVILNNNEAGITSTISATTGFNMTAGATSVTFANGGSPVTLTGGTSTFADLQAVKTSQLYVEKTGSAGHYFLMTNAPLSLLPGGTYNPAPSVYGGSPAGVQTLVELPATFFFHTMEEARANPAAQVYVERAAAKVSMGVTDGLDHHVQGNTTIDFDNSDIKFSMVQYNQGGYLTRHFKTDWLAYNAEDNSVAKGYRMVEQQQLLTDRYRTYWAEDPNPDSNSGLTGQHGWFEVGNTYCIGENTTTVGAMTEENTTAVVVRIRMNNAKDFYTCSTTGSDIIYQLPANRVTEDGTSASESFSRPRRSRYVSEAKTIDEYLRQWLMDTNPAFRDWVRQYAAGEPKHVNISVYTYVSGDGDKGKKDAKVTAVTQTAQPTGSTGATAFDALNLKDYFDNNITINYYWSGYVFYRVPIMHFGNELTPWHSTADMTNNTTAQTYQDGTGTQTADVRYLGRYGVVRNNWYTIKVSSVTHVGSPIFPVPTTNACDQVEQLLNATLTINGWDDQGKNL